MELSVFQEVLRAVSTALKTPVIIILIIFIAFAVFCIGWIIVEEVAERRHMRYSLPKLLDQMKNNKGDLTELIEESGLLRRQKDALLELTKHPDFDKDMLVSLADNLLEKEQSHYDVILKLTGVVSKLAPMFGLLGTLIPLGPGIIALGQGDTLTLSNSMLTAFDTTIAGLIAAGICLVVHTIRTHWYAGYMSDLETLVDSVVDLELELNSEDKNSDSLYPKTADNDKVKTTDNKGLKTEEDINSDDRKNSEKIITDAVLDNPAEARIV